MRKGVRSATGCKECRLGRVKCDETHPKCKRCTKRQTACTYVPKLQWRNMFKDATPPLQNRSKSRREPGTSRPASQVTSAGPRDLVDTTLRPGHHIWAPLNPSVDTELPSHGTSTTLDQDLDAHWSTSDILDLPDSFPDLEQIMHTDSHGSVTIPSITVPRDTLHFDVEQGSALMEIYFERVAPIFCCYDGGKNPFHHLIAQAWNSDRKSLDFAPLIGAAQGLAAVFLMHDAPDFGPIADSIQEWTQQQLQCVPAPENHDVKHMLALVLLGISRMYSRNMVSSLAVLHDLRIILQAEDACSTSGANELSSRNRDRRFFWGLQLHCEMVFACTDPQYHLSSLDDFPQAAWDDGKLEIYPHPFTGVSSRITMRFLQAALLVRRHRTLSKVKNFCTQKHLTKIRSLMSDAADLEESVISDRLPDESCIKSPEDQATPVDHLIKMAECYRDATLLQIYRMFPDILAQRLGYEENSTGLNENAAHDDEHLLSMALNIVELLSSIPVTSSTTPFQWVILLSAASELRLPQGVLDTTCTSRIWEDVEIREPDPMQNLEREMDVLKARDFILLRTQTSQKCIPGERLPKLLCTMDTIWSMLDSGQTTVHWLDILAE